MQHRVQYIGLASVVYLLGSWFAPRAVQAQVPLTRADIEAIHNDVFYLPESGNARPARLSDWLDVGDAVRTAAAARADLRFNDGSLARVGSQATFWFVPNTRTFRLSNGTALFLVPPGRDPSTIETPGVVTGIQGTGVIVRHISETAPGATAAIAASTESTPVSTSSADRTIVMALTNNPGGPVRVSLPDGQSVELVAGEMAIAAAGTLEVLEFDLQLFYATSPLVADLHLDDPDHDATGSPTAPVRQETLEGLAQQANFVGARVLNPAVLNSEMPTATVLDGPVSFTLKGMAAATATGDRSLQFQEEAVDSSLVANSAPRDAAIVRPAAVYDVEASLLGPDSLLPQEVATFDQVGGLGSSVLPPGVVEPAVTPPAPPMMPPVPVTPASPLTPDAPSELAAPVTQVDPGDPGQPGEPGAPATPAAPADPGQPGGPAIPATPADPGAPGEPAIPAAPADPAQPETEGEEPDEQVPDALDELDAAAADVP